MTTSSASKNNEEGLKKIHNKKTEILYVSKNIVYISINFREELHTSPQNEKWVDPCQYLQRNSSDSWKFDDSTVLTNGA